MEYNQLKFPNACPSYLENQPVKPFYHTNLKDSLEGITLNPMPEKQYNGICVAGLLQFEVGILKRIW